MPLFGQIYILTNRFVVKKNTKKVLVLAIKWLYFTGCKSLKNLNNYKFEKYLTWKELFEDKSNKTAISVQL